MGMLGVPRRAGHGMLPFPPFLPLSLCQQYGWQVCWKLVRKAGACKLVRQLGSLFRGKHCILLLPQSSAVDVLTLSLNCAFL